MAASRRVLSRGLADAWVGVVGAGRNGGGGGGVAVVMWSVLIVRVPVRILNRRCVAAARSLRAARAVIVHGWCLRGRGGLIDIRALRRRPLGLLHFGPAILNTEGRNSPRLDQPARLGNSPTLRTLSYTAHPARNSTCRPAPGRARTLRALCCDNTGYRISQSRHRHDRPAPSPLIPSLRLTRASCQGRAAWPLPRPPPLRLPGVAPGLGDAREAPRASRGPEQRHLEAGQHQGGSKSGFRCGAVRSCRPISESESAD